MAETFLSPVVADAMICERISQLADEIIAAGRGIAVQMHRPGDTAETYQMAGVSQALQAVIQRAHRAGTPDGALFVALASAIGYFANAQQLGADEVVCHQLGLAGVRSATEGRKAVAAGFETRGNA